MTLRFVITCMRTELEQVIKFYRHKEKQCRTLASEYSLGPDWQMTASARLINEANIWAEARRELEKAIEDA